MSGGPRPLCHKRRQSKFFNGCAQQDPDCWQDGWEVFVNRYGEAILFWRPGDGRYPEDSAFEKLFGKYEPDAAPAPSQGSEKR